MCFSVVMGLRSPSNTAGTYSALEENYEGCEVILKVCISYESWRVLDQVQEVRYQP
jgi:hypothetical protein